MVSGTLFSLLEKTIVGVLILVLMDYGFGEFLLNLLHLLQCLNPCSNGLWFRGAFNISILIVR